MGNEQSSTKEEGEIGKVSREKTEAVRPSCPDTRLKNKHLMCSQSLEGQGERKNSGCV